MANWHRFVPRDFEYDDSEQDKRGEHGVTFREAVECFSNDIEVHRNRFPHRDRYQLIGRTDGGRRLKIISQLKRGNVVRIITGWPI